MKKAVVLKLFLFLFVLLGLTACGGGGSDSAPTGGGDDPVVETATQDITGGVIKGPLTNAIVSVFTFNAENPGLKFKGTIIDTGTTNSNAAITGLNLPLPLNPPYIMEFTSDANTLDMTTNAPPAITTMRTVITKSMLDSGNPIYTTPLTTMAVDLAISNADSNTPPWPGNGDAKTTETEFLLALPIAANQVISTLGFGADGSVDIFNTPPLINDDTTTQSEQEAVAAYRTAVEAITAIAYQIDQQTSGGDVDSVLADLAADLADDGIINGSAGTAINPNTLQLLQQDPARLPIPTTDPTKPTNLTVSDVQMILKAEKEDTGSTTPTPDLGAFDLGTTLAATKPDSDGDGVLNADDAFPDDRTESVDTDGDGIGDNADPDDDNNGILDVDEGIVAAPTALDTDGDGVNDDAPDNCPADFNPTQTNTDALLTGSDTLGDVCDADDDGDGVVDTADAFPLDVSESIDTDNDGLGDNVADDDDDNDGLSDTEEGALGTDPLLADTDSDGAFDSIDKFPMDPAEQKDTDNDGLGDNVDTDDDNDTVDDTTELTDGTKPLIADTDGDTLDDGVEKALGTNPLLADTDGDGANDNVDIFPLDPTETIDTDTDGVGDVGDNCPAVANPTQTNTDGVADGGDACDTDDDNDGLTDIEEAALGTNPLLVDTDGDGANDNVDIFPFDPTETVDTDTDGVGDVGDNCPVVANPTQTNTDGVADGGDACDTDDDNDGLTDIEEAALGTNPLLVDTDGDGANDNVDIFPFDPTETIDTDTDGVGDAGDNCPVVANPTQTNTDGVADGGDACDTDDDNDGLTDIEEAALGTNPLLVDTDGDTVNDDADNCPVVSNQTQTNTDGVADGGDACDADDDNDGLTDIDEAALGTNPLLVDTDGDGANDNVDIFPLDPTETIDTDTDGVGDVGDNCPINANPAQTNTDGDAQGDVCDADDDNDGLTDAEEAALGTNPLLADTDGDGVNDNVDLFPTDATETIDSDSDGVGDFADNCHAIANPAQTNTDGDAQGDVCDADDDNDGLTDAEEVALGTNPLLADTDGDGVNDNVDLFPTDATETIDSDSDGVGDFADNCHAIANPAQTNTDGDTQGDVCDADDDNDGLLDSEEVALGTNSLLVDTDGGGVGDGAEVNAGTNPLDSTDDIAGAAPTFGAPLVDAQQGSLYSYSIVLNDADTNPAALSLTDFGLPVWLTLDAAGRELKGTPGNDDVGDHFITLQVDDGINFVQQDFTITVANVNDAPTINSVLPSTTLSEGGSFRYTVNASDIDFGDNLSFSISTLPSWLSFNTDSGLLSNSAPAVIGSYPVTITVTDDGTVPSALNATQSFTIVVNPPGIPIDMTLLMGPTNGGIASIDNVGPNEYEYWTDNFDSASGVFTGADYMYNHSSGQFEISNGFGGELILNGNAWLVVDNIIGIDDGNGGLTLTLRDSANTPLNTIKLTARYVDIEDEPIANYLDSVWQGAMIGSNEKFSAGAKLITEYFESQSVSYEMHQDIWCENYDPALFAILNGDCNAIGVSGTSTGYAEILSDVTVAAAWMDPNDPDDFSIPPGTINLAWEGSITLMVQLVDGGAANYYVVDWSSTDGATRVADVVAGSNWVQNSVPGVEMIQFQVPASFVAQFPGDLGETLDYFLTVDNGFVRRGQKYEVGSTGYDDGAFNGNAMADILKNFSAPALPVVQDPAELVGTWVSSNLSTNSDPFVIHFFANGYYESSGTCDFDDPVSTGMEYGIYTWDPATGSYDAGAQFTNQGACGPEAGMFNGNTIAVNGDVLTLSVPGLGDIIFNRLLGTANPIVGSWIQGDILDPGEGHIIVTFLDDSTIVTSQNCVNDGVAGFEYGAYTWDSGNTNALSSSLSVDANGGCGFSGLPAGATATVSGDRLTLNIPGDGDFFFKRHSPAAAVALTCDYSSGWDDALNEPLVYNSFTDFEQVVADCGGTTPTADADVIGTWVNSYDDFGVTVVETWVFNGDNTASYTETRAGEITDGGDGGTVDWLLSNGYVSLGFPDDFLDVWAITPSGVKIYTELFYFSTNPDLSTLDGVKEGEISGSGLTKQ